MIESPFVRTSAVVRCESCQHKYRIKSSYVERVLTTGPRTLDEADAVLRTDSVDIDPDEVAPVSIDDDGNVVGLSGLSELMRQSDAKGSMARVQAQMEEPPMAKQPGSAQAMQVTVELRDPPDAPAGTGRRRGGAGGARRKKKTNNGLLIGMLAGLLVVTAVVLAVVLMGDKDDPPPQTAGNNNPSPPAKPNPDDTASNPSDPVTPQPGPDPTDPRPDGERFDNVGPPHRNPDFIYRPPWPTPDPTQPPADTPTVLTPSVRVEHEGWYVMSPPRGSAQAIGESDVELGELIPQPIDDSRTLLAGTIVNRSPKALLSGELHVMLLDSSGRVFAETFMPLVMIGAGAEHRVGLPIATRHWKRARGVRTSVSVNAWGDKLSPMPGVVLDPVGKGAQAVLRVSARHMGEVALRGVLIQLEATDEQGRLIARYVVENEQIYVGVKDWLDMVVATPLDPSQEAANWSAVLQPR